MAKHRRSAPQPWFWLLGAAAGAAAVYFIFIWHRPAGSLPVPGEATEPATKAPAVKEEITNSDRDALDRLLRERPKPR